MIQISDEKNSIVIDTDDTDITITPITRPVKFISEDQEELTVRVCDTEGFIIDYLDEDDVVHTYSFATGFVRRTSLRGRTRNELNSILYDELV